MTAAAANPVAALAEAQEAAGWPDLAPLYRSVPDGEPPPLEALGPVLGPAADAITRVIQVPASAAVSAVLSSAALAVQPHADVVVDGRACPTSMFFVTVLESGQRKTAADRAALAPHYAHMKEEADDHRRRLHEYQCEMEAWSKSQKECLNKKTFEERKRALMDLGPAPIPPMAPHRVIEEPSYEGLVKLMAVAPHIGLFTSEASRFIGGFAMKEDNRLKTLGGLTAIWDGQPITRVRGGDGTSVLYGRRLSMHLMAQPMVAAGLLGDRIAADQGFIARCCVCAPKTLLGQRVYAEAVVSDQPGWREFEDRIGHLLRRPLPMGAGGDPFELEPRPLILIPSAKALYVNFQRWKESHLGPGGELRLAPAWAERAPEHALRFAGMLTIIADPEAREVDAISMESGILWAHFYLSEALRLREVAATSEELQDAARLLEWIRDRGDPLVALPDVYQLGPASVRDRKTAGKLMQILVDHGHVRAVTGGAVVNGKRRRDVFELRPEGL